MAEPGLRADQVPVWLRALVRVLPGLDTAAFGAPAGASDGRPSAVLMLFGEAAAHGPDVLLIRRADALRSHAGQPAFPGGAVDPEDDGPAGTALREAAEEVGLDTAGVRVLAALPRLYVAPSGFLVTPVVAWWATPGPVGVVDPAEVAQVERVPIAELVDPANRFRVRHPSGRSGPAFSVRGMLVWGFTAGLLDRAVGWAGWALPWNTGDVRELPPAVLDAAMRGRLAAGPPSPHDAPAADDTGADLAGPESPGTVAG